MLEVNYRDRDPEIDRGVVLSGSETVQGIIFQTYKPTLSPKDTVLDLPMGADGMLFPTLVARVPSLEHPIVANRNQQGTLIVLDCRDPKVDRKFLSARFTDYTKVQEHVLREFGQS